MISPLSRAFSVGSTGQHTGPSTLSVVYCRCPWHRATPRIDGSLVPWRHVHLYSRGRYSSCAVVLPTVTACLDAINSWMASNCLKLNMEKTQLIWLGTAQQLRSISERSRWQQWWVKSNRDSIQSRFESQRRFDSNIARFDSSTMRFDTDSIQISTIRFKRHAIWTEISKSRLK